MDFRLISILNLIRTSKFGIHDLSRHTAQYAGEFSRFNLPFELGLDIGSKVFGGSGFANKKIIVLDHALHDYDSYLGDLSGQDIITHKGDPRILMNEVRDWFSRIYQHKLLPGTDSIWRAYFYYNDALKDKLKPSWSQEDIENMQMSEYRKFANQWIKIQENEGMIA